MNLPVEIKTNCLVTNEKSNETSKNSIHINSFSCKIEHLRTGLTNISENDRSKEEVHRTATSPGFLDLLTGHKWTFFCGDTSKPKSMLTITKY